MTNRRKLYDIEGCYRLCTAILDDCWRQRTPEAIAFIKHGWITKMMGVEADDISGALTRRRQRDALFPGLERKR